jgi:hypothetical protein
LLAGVKGLAFYGIAYVFDRLTNFAANLAGPFLNFATKVFSLTFVL